MKKVAYSLLIFSFLIFLISLIYLFVGNRPVQTETFYASVEVGDEGGFDLNSSDLIFGKIQKLGSSTRTINFQNGYDFPVLALISAEGGIKPLLSFEKRVIIEKGSSKRISFSVSAPPEANMGFYSGNVTFDVFKKK